MTPPHVLNTRARIVLSDFVNDQTTADILTDHLVIDTQASHVGEDPNPRNGHISTGTRSPDAVAGLIIPDDHLDSDTQRLAVVGDPQQLNGQTSPGAQAMRAVEPQNPHPTMPGPTPTIAASGGDLDSGDHSPPDTHSACVAAPTPQDPAIERPTPRCGPSGLADPLLALAADVLDDLERVRIANENRLRQLTRDETDADGQERGFGLTLDHPDVARLAALVAALSKAEHDAELNLKRMVRRHPLGPWIKQSKGVGEKQAARLLGAIGDPYWNDLHNRPRLVSELWSFCGYSVHRLPASQELCSAQKWPAGGAPTPVIQGQRDTQGTCDDGSQPPTSQKLHGSHTGLAGGALTDSNPDQPAVDTHSPDVGVAVTRQRGMKVNWSPTAKMRSFLIAESIVKAGGPYRQVYDDARVKYAEATHRVECKRCGPAGKPAPIGSLLSKGHQHARALRLVAKTVLRDLWRESKRLHETQAEHSS